MSSLSIFFFIYLFIYFFFFAGEEPGYKANQHTVRDFESDQSDVDYQNAAHAHGVDATS